MIHTSCLELGDNFATAVEPNNEEDVDFELLMCIKPQYIIEVQFTSAWGEQFNVGDLVVEARYYQKWGTGNRNYIFMSKSCVAIVHVDHLKNVKFPMLPLDHRVQDNVHVYQLPVSSEIHIRQALELDY